MKIIPYSSNHAKEWDHFVKTIGQDTLLHTRKFLSYHGERFVDKSLLLFDDAKSIQAVFPAAINPKNSNCIISHPGATYGGLVINPNFNATEVQRAIEIICKYYHTNNFKEIRWKTVPSHLATPNAPFEHWALLQTGFNVVSMDIWNIINLQLPRNLSKRRRKLLRDLKSSGICVSQGGLDDIPIFHNILTQNLNEKYNTVPVHSVEELFFLFNQFPNQIQLLKVCCNNNSMLGGTVLFQASPHCTHTQYIASSQQGRELSALKLLLEEAIENSMTRGNQYFSFGASTEKRGTCFNLGLYKFKSSFGSEPVNQVQYKFTIKT